MAYNNSDFRQSSKKPDSRQFSTTRPKEERIPPLKPTQRGNYAPSYQKLDYHKKRGLYNIFDRKSTKGKPLQKSNLKNNRSKIGDFLLGFIAGLAIFGIGALFVCKALMDMIS